MFNFDFNNFLNNNFLGLCNFSNSLKETINKVELDIENLEKHNEQYYIVDKIVDKIAICEKANTDSIITIPIKDISGDIQEGDCLVINEGRYEINEELTNERKVIIKEKMNRLFE